MEAKEVSAMLTMTGSGMVLSIVALAALFVLALVQGSNDSD
jgi:hypothetical protein